MGKETLFYIKAKTPDAEEKLKALSEAGEIEIMPMDYIPEWQQKETLRRLAYMKQHPESVLSLEEFPQMLLSDDED